MARVQSLAYHISMGIRTVWALKLLNATLAALGVSAAICACGGPGDRIKEITNKTPEPSPTQGERELSGVYTVNGSGPNDADPYNGVLNITPSGDVYSLRWQTNRGTRIGTAVQLGDAASATVAGTGAGEGCGIVLYRISSDGALDGRQVMWNGAEFGTEKGIRTEGRNFPGTYDISGKSAEGKDYSGRLTITKDGEGFLFEWKLDKPRIGFGIQKGSYAAVSFGGRQCSFVLYRIMGSSGLDGSTGGQARVTFGTESAKRQ
jgi:hypothetical protein